MWNFRQNSVISVEELFFSAAVTPLQLLLDTYGLYIVLFHDYLLAEPEIMKLIT